MSLKGVMCEHVGVLRLHFVFRAWSVAFSLEVEGFGPWRRGLRGVYGPT